MLQLYQDVGQRPYYQASHMRCGMWKPPTLAVQDNSGNVVYPDAVGIRNHAQGAGTSASIYIYKAIDMFSCFMFAIHS